MRDEGRDKVLGFGTRGNGFGIRKEGLGIIKLCRVWD